MSAALRLRGQQNQMKHELPGTNEFLRDYPGMSRAPAGLGEVVFKGDFDFTATYRDGVEITESYALKISVPLSFPNAIPKVWELGDKIPNDGRHHLNPNKTLCLGAPIHVLKKVKESPTVVGFAENCIVPFLYAVSRKIRDGKDFVMGELEHGEPGVIQDYERLFGITGRDQVLRVLESLSLKKRIANKRPCPCNCGLRLGKCSIRHTVNYYRRLAPRSWFRKHFQKPGAAM